MRVYPYFAKDEGKTIVKNSTLPTAGINFKKYFPLYGSIREQGQICYTKCLLGMDQEPEEMVHAAGPYLRNNNAALYLKSVQSEKSVIIAWALHSNRDTNVKELSSELSRILKTEVGARFQAISMYNRSNPIKKNNKSVVRAVHIEVGKETVERVKPKLKLLMNGKNRILGNRY